MSFSRLASIESPAQSSFHFVYIGQIIKEKVGAVFGQPVAGPRASRDRNGAGTENLATRDIVPGITDHVHVARRKIDGRFRDCPSKGTRAERVAIVMIIGKRAEREKFPEIIMLELQLRPSPQISGEQTKGEVLLSSRAFKEMVDPGKDSAFATWQFLLEQIEVSI
jgi:hypothetical protein